MTNSLSVKKRLALATAGIRDPSGFWTIDHVQPGRGQSLRTHAHHLCENGVRVLQVHYSPGPWDMASFGADSIVAQPSSTYSVYTGIAGQPDDLSRDAAVALIEAAQPTVDRQALHAGSLDIWSPDGEGEVYWRFTDEQVEDALRFADSLSATPAEAEVAHA